MIVCELLAAVVHAGCLFFQCIAADSPMLQLNVYKLVDHRGLFQHPRPLLCRRRSSEAFKVFRFESLPAACCFRARAVEKEKIRENFENVIARCVLQSGALEVYSKLVHQELSRHSGRENCLRGRRSDRC